MRKKTAGQYVAEAIEHVINGLRIDGAHHKQHDLEQALLSLCCDDEEVFQKLKNKYEWEDGIIP